MASQVSIVFKPFSRGGSKPNIAASLPSGTSSGFSEIPTMRFLHIGEIVNERLGAVIYRLEATRNEPGKRSHLLQQIQGAGDVGIKDVSPLRCLLIKESMPKAVPGIGATAR